MATTVDWLPGTGPGLLLVTLYAVFGVHGGGG
jgi:hypothetical protein